MASDFSDATVTKTEKKIKSKEGQRSSWNQNKKTFEILEGKEIKALKEYKTVQNNRNLLPLLLSKHNRFFCLRQFCH